MRHIGHPMLGDSMYATGKTLESSDRLLLHAHSLRFRHPNSGDVMQFFAPCEMLPETFRQKYPVIFPYQDHRQL